MHPVTLAILGGIVVFCMTVALCQFMRRPRAPRKPKVEIPTVNRRKVVRIPMNSEIDIFWQDIDASHKSIRTMGVDMSERGACVRSPKPIECNSVVYIRARHIPFEGSAIVRRCTRKGFQYLIGLELEGPATKSVGLGA